MRKFRLKNAEKKLNDNRIGAVDEWMSAASCVIGSLRNTNYVIRSLSHQVKRG